MSSVGRSAAHKQAATKYMWLASFSRAAGWRRAYQRFVIKLCWVEIFRTPASKVIFDSRDEQTGLGSRSIFY